MSLQCTVQRRQRCKQNQTTMKTFRARRGHGGSPEEVAELPTVRSRADSEQKQSPQTLCVLIAPNMEKQIAGCRSSCWRIQSCLGEITYKLWFTIVCTAVHDLSHRPDMKSSAVKTRGSRRTKYS